MINLAVPNYPYREMDVAMVDILSVIQFLKQEGFELSHPTEDRMVPEDQVKVFLDQSYLNRQMQVDLVRNIVHNQQ